MFKKEKNKVGVVILAAGNGKRMQSELPKVMHQLRGKTLVEHVVDNVVESSVCDKPVVVVPADHTMVQDVLGGKASYAVQKEQLGTGHAVAVAEEMLSGKVDHVFVLYGDMPFLRPGSINRIVQRHLERANIMTLATFNTPNFEGNYSPFKSFGRVMRRPDDGHIAKIVEMKDCTEEQLEVKELNPSYYVFRADWLWSHLKKLKNNNAQNEYYLGDVLPMAIEEGEKVSSVAIDPHEALGINSKEDMAIISNLVKILEKDF